MVLDPGLERATEERRALRERESRVRTEQLAREERDRLAQQVQELSREVTALRESWSWKVTGPLRWLYGRLGGSR